MANPPKRGRQTLPAASLRSFASGRESPTKGSRYVFVAAIRP